MFTRSWGKLASHIAAGLIVAGLVTWSATAGIHAASGPSVPTLPEPEWFQVAIGVLGLVGLLCTVVFARRAWLESRRSADEAKRSADVAEAQLKKAREDSWNNSMQHMEQLREAKNATRVAQKIGEAQVRAYLSVSDLSIEFDGPLSLAFIATNTGQSPARYARTRNLSCIFEFKGIDGGPVKYAITSLASEDVHHGDIPAGQSRRAKIALPFAENDREAVEKLLRSHWAEVQLSMFVVWWDVFGSRDHKLPIGALGSANPEALHINLNQLPFITYDAVKQGMQAPMSEAD